MHVLDSPIRKQQTIGMLEMCRPARSTIDHAQKIGALFGMDALHHQIDCWLNPVAVLEDAIGFIGPDYLSSIRSPPEAARVTEPLSFRQVRFAPAEFLGQELVFRNVYGAANVLFQALVFDNRGTDATNVPDLTIGTHDALCCIEGRSFRQDSLDQVGHGLAILWVDTIQVFLNTGRFAGRIESVHP